MNIYFIFLYQIGLRCDSAVASIYHEGDTDEMENCEMLFTHEGTYMHAYIHVCIHNIVGDYKVDCHSQKYLRALSTKQGTHITSFHVNDFR